MCYHKQDQALKKDLEDRYKATLRDIDYYPSFYENGFDFDLSPVLTAENQNEFVLKTWGLIPWWTKSLAEAQQIRIKTLNCISEEMFTKPSFRDAIKNGNRCIIPCTGFYEWRWFNGGKVKYPYFIYVKEQPIFSLAGIYSNWVDRSTGETFHTYSVLTTKANLLMEKIHNSKKRMPLILPLEYERDWLNPNLTEKDVTALSVPYPHEKMDAYTISKMITDRKIDNKNIREICQPFEYPELALLDS